MLEDDKKLPSDAKLIDHDQKPDFLYAIVAYLQ